MLNFFKRCGNLGVTNCPNQVCRHCVRQCATFKHHLALSSQHLGGSKGAGPGPDHIRVKTLALFGPRVPTPHWLTTVSLPLRVCRPPCAMGLGQQFCNLRSFVGQLDMQEEGDVQRWSRTFPAFGHTACMDLVALVPPVAFQPIREQGAACC